MNIQTLVRTQGKPHALTVWLKRVLATLRLINIVKIGLTIQCCHKCSQDSILNLRKFSGLEKADLEMLFRLTSISIMIIVAEYYSRATRPSYLWWPVIDIVFPPVWLSVEKTCQGQRKFFTWLKITKIHLAIYFMQFVSGWVATTGARITLQRLCSASVVRKCRLS